MPESKKLQKENLDLKRKLAESQDELRAIQEGAVDAVVVGRNKKKHIYSLANTIVSNILETITDGFVSFDEKWNILYINHQAAKTLSRKPEDLVGKNFWKEFPSYKNTVFGKLYQKSMKDKKVRFYEDYFAPLNAWFSVRVYPSKFGLSLYFQDITSQKKVDELLKQSETKFYTLTTNAPVGIFMTDIDGNCLYVNEMWQKLAGIPFAKAKGQGWTKIIHPADREKVFIEWQKAVTKKKIFHLEYRFQTPEGKVSWLEGNAVSLKNDQGKIIGYIGTVSDITSRKAAEEKLIHSQERLMLAQSAGKIGTFEWLLPENKVIWTPELERLYGMSEGEFGNTYESWIKRVHPDDVEKVEKHLKEVIAHSGMYNIEFRIMLPDGAIKWMLGTGAFFNRDTKNAKRMVGINIDITARKLLEKQKDEFISIASHELKTPVTSIKGYGQVLKMMLEQKGEAKAASIVGKMDGQLNKLTDLIGDLLDVTKIEAGRLQLTLNKFVFNDLVTEVVEAMQLTTDKHKLIQKSNVYNFIKTDRDRIGQVLTNLISNAIKYSPHATKIIIYSEIVDSYVQVCVQDFGVGIPKDKKDHVFERFFRVSGPNTSTFPGLGLGLYISSEIVKRLDGKIWVESIKGRGSTFCFRIPLKKKPERKNK